MVTSIGGGYITTLFEGPCVRHWTELLSPDGTEAERVRRCGVREQSETDVERGNAGRWTPLVIQLVELEMMHSLGWLVRTAPGMVMQTGGG